MTPTGAPHTMAKKPYQVTVLTPQGCSSYITLATGGSDAISHALGQFPGLRKASAALGLMQAQDLRRRAILSAMENKATRARSHSLSVENYFQNNVMRAQSAHKYR